MEEPGNEATTIHSQFSTIHAVHDQLCTVICSNLPCQIEARLIDSPLQSRQIFIAAAAKGLSPGLTLQPSHVTNEYANNYLAHAGYR